ncbi:hypothetical protein D3C72_1903440 [compost metagenome]
MEAKLRYVAIDGAVVAEGFDELAAKLGDLDIDLVRELMTDRTGRQRRRRLGVGGVFFDDQYRAIEVRVGCQEIGR